MGARQRAQKRGKGTPKAAKGSLKGSPSSQKQANSSLQVASLDPISRGSYLQGWQNFAISSSPNNRNGYSMSQEARNTERHVFGWGASKLRENGITFVSAGHLHQDEWQKAPSDDQPITCDQKYEDSKAQHKQSRSSPSHSSHTETVAAASRKHVEPQQQQETPTTVILEADKTGSHDQVSQFNSLRTRPSSVSSSESEQIVFTGRSGSRMPSQKGSRNVSRSRPDAKLIAASIEAESVSQLSTEVSQPIPIRSQLKPLSTSAEPVSVQMRQKHSRRDRRGRRRPQYISDEDEAIMQDYIANMAVDDTDDEQNHETSKPVRRNETLRFYGGSGEENAKVQIQQLNESSSFHANKVPDLEQAVDWNSDDLGVFDGMSTCDEDVDDVEQILNRRNREGVLQYLVAAKGKSVNEAKWIRLDRLVSASAIEEVRIFDEIDAMQFEDDSFDEDENSSGTEDDEALHDLVEEIESEDDENARIMSLTSRMTDEQIAKALAKQEELGMGADELVLFGGETGLDVEEEDDFDVFDRGDDFVSFSTKKHTSNRTRAKHNKKARDIFPPATAFADALDEDPYGGFDIMDFDRPSLRPRKKGRKSGFPYNIELEDDELKDHLVSTWMKDREKKALRKREKEEARMAAALDASERSEPAVIKAEIRRFLCQEMDVLKLSPMDPATRASVHRLAKALRLNSRSEGTDGKGGGRYPVLSKTVRTPSYTIDTIWEVDALLNTRKFFPKNSILHKKSKVARGTITRARRTGGIQGATYMNGEVVGASAPEIGAENKGRAMLEKMGWSVGMGIGAEGNKGGLEAIKHVVKTTKAGLG